MSKAGRQRRSKERRIADKENRSSLKYLEKLTREVEHEQREKMLAEMMGADAEGNYTPEDPNTVTVDITPEQAAVLLSESK